MIAITTEPGGEPARTDGPHNPEQTRAISQAVPEMQVNPATGEHVGRPIARPTDYGHIMILCPVGHLVQTVAEGDWSGSLMETLVHDPAYTVTCQGAYTIPARRSS